MDQAGIQSYINYLLKQVNDDQSGEPYVALTREALRGTHATALGLTHRP